MRASIVGFGVFCLFTSPVAAAAPEPPPLAVELVRTSPEVIEPGGDVTVTMHLVNRSAAKTVWVVRPGDGSEMGWREPWVYFSGTRLLADGSEEASSAASLARCGLFDANWPASIVALKPGERMDLHPWIPEPSRGLALDRRGAHTVRLHYAFRAGTGDRWAGGAAGPHALFGTAPFEIISNPINVTVRSPLALVATPAKDLPTLHVGRPVALSRLFTAAIVNDSDTPVSVTSPGTPTVFRLETRPEGYLAGVEAPTPRATPRTIALKPVERVELLGRGAPLSTAADGTWTPAKAGPIAIYVVFHESEVGRLKGRLVSEPMLFDVQP